MRPEILDVLNHQETLRGPANFGHARQRPARKDIPVNPGIHAVAGSIAADGLEQEYPFLLQASMDDFHECFIVFLSNMFKHPDGNDLVEASFDLPVIRAEDLHRQIFAVLAGIADLLFGDVDGRHRATIMFGGIAGIATPSATDVQALIIGPQVYFPADEVELFPLGLRQIVRSLKIGATVLIAGSRKERKRSFPRS